MFRNSNIHQLIGTTCLINQDINKRSAEVVLEIPKLIWFVNNLSRQAYSNARYLYHIETERCWRIFWKSVYILVPLDLPDNWRIDYPFVGISQMTFSPAKGGLLRNAMTHNAIWANQNTEFIVYCWQRAHAIFHVTCFPEFFGAANVIQKFLISVNWQQCIVRLIANA